MIICWDFFFCPGHKEEYETAAQVVEIKRNEPEKKLKKIKNRCNLQVMCLSHGHTAVKDQNAAGIRESRPKRKQHIDVCTPIPEHEKQLHLEPLANSVCFSS